MNISELNTEIEPTWCPGCGAYGFLAAIKKAITDLKVPPKEVVITYDIGCAANMINNLNVCGFTTLHGRSIPVAVGVKMANPKLTVIAQGGEGGVLTEGGNHLIHAAQRDDDITVLINNNYVFGLTAGQASAATPIGTKTKTTPEGNPYPPISAVDLVAVCGGSFLARTLAMEVEKTASIIGLAIKHKGFSLVEIIQPCVIWAKDLQKYGPTDQGVWLDKPLLDPKEIVGKESLLGVLYERQTK